VHQSGLIAQELGFDLPVMRYFRLMTAVEWYIVRIHHSQLLNVEILAILLPMKRDFFAEAAGDRNIKVTRIQTNTRVGV